MVTSLPPELANCAPLKALIQAFEQAIENSEKFIAEKSKIAESSNWFLSNQKKWEIERARENVEREKRSQLQRRQALKAVSAPFSYRVDHPWTFATIEHEISQRLAKLWADSNHKVSGYIGPKDDPGAPYEPVDLCRVNLGYCRSVLELDYLMAKRRDLLQDPKTFEALDSVAEMKKCQQRRQSTPTLVLAVRDLPFSNPFESEQHFLDEFILALGASKPLRFRLLASIDDLVTADSARSLLAAIIAHNLTAITFQLTGNGTTSEVYLEIAINGDFAPTLEKLLTNFYPQAQLEPQPAETQQPEPTCTAAYACGPALLHRFSDFNPDPLSLFANTLAELQPSEQASFRVDFLSVPEIPFQVMLNCTDEWKQKTLAGGGWAVGVSLAIFSPEPGRSRQLLHALEHCLGQYASPQGKLSTTFPPWASCDIYVPSYLRGKSLLTTEELSGLFHLPHKSLQCPILLRANMQTKKAPDELTQPKGLLVGSNDWRKQSKEVRLPHHLRSRHTYIVGASGSGKSNLLKNCIRQDIEDGRGLCVIDPHGDLVSDVLPFIPESRLADVIIFNPSDRDFPVSINPFVPTTDDNRNDVALTFKTTFIRMFNVSDEARRMLNLLHFCTLALLEAGQKTFLDIRKFLINPDFRRTVLKSINDPTVLEFWYEEFPSTYPKASVAPISTRLAQFALSPVTRNILGQKQQAFDLYDVMNSGKILLCSLGKIQEEERQLLGSLLVSQLQLATMRRAELPEGDRCLFPLYIDEFQNFASDAESLEKILSEARKYNLALILAHQFTSQLPTKLADAIIANAYSKIIFRVGVDDARYLEKALSGYTAEDLQNQKIGQAVMCAGRAQDSFNLGTFKFPDPPPKNQAQAILEHSRQTYGTPRATVEALLRPTAPPPEEEERAAKPEPAIAAVEAGLAPRRQPRKPSKTKAATAPEANIFDELLNSD